MLTIKNYVRAQSLDEAYALCQKRSNVVLGGMLWLKLQNRKVHTAIDLCDLGLDQITEDSDSFRIGAMVSLRALETHPGLNEMTQGAVADSLRSIVGVQFRNLATIGGSLYGRFGFSDVLTLFLVLNASVRLHHRGVISVAELAALPRGTRDILVEVIVPKAPMQVAYLSQRNSATDFPVVSCGVSCIGGVYRCAVGARPEKAALLTDETGLLSPKPTPEQAEAFGAWVARSLNFKGNMRAGSEYRRRVCAVLVRRGILLLEEK